jgi:hypothetical protein
MARSPTVHPSTPSAPEDLGGAGRRGVETLRLQEIGAVHGRGRDAQPQRARLENGSGHLAYAQRRLAARRVDHDRLHGAQANKMRAA